MKFLRNNVRTFTFFKFYGLLHFLGIRPAHNPWQLVWYKDEQLLELSTPKCKSYDLIKEVSNG